MRKQNFIQWKMNAKRLSWKSRKSMVEELKQRISIARAIMKDAPIVILDEATANVDPENEKELMDAVDALTKEKTIIMIAHRLKTVRHADQIVVVDKGRIVQQGTHEQLMKQEGIYKRFVDARQLAVSWKLAAVDVHECKWIPDSESRL